RQASTTNDRLRCAVVGNADAPRKEEVYRLWRAGREYAGVLQEERTFLGKEDREAREIDPLVIDLHLREVGVVREVERERRRDTVFDFTAHFRGRGGSAGTAVPLRLRRREHIRRDRLDA